jgi:hypothetical protein
MMAAGGVAAAALACVKGGGGGKICPRLGLRGDVFLTMTVLLPVFAMTVRLFTGFFTGFAAGRKLFRLACLRTMVVPCGTVAFLGDVSRIDSNNPPTAPVIAAEKTKTMMRME